MRSMKGTMFAAVALVALAACSKEKAPEAAPVVAAPTSATVSSPPTATTTAMATAPAAPATATMATAATSGPMSVNTAQDGDAGDSSWVAQVDVDGDSTAADATFVWDDEEKILYIAVEDDEVCAAGGVAMANTLTALFATGNVAGAPVGSGWTATYLDATECGAAEPVLWGERFDATGAVTEAGVATIDPATGDLVIATATAAPADTTSGM
ncbi:MAG TPA: hypothetical protein PLI70_08065 [Gemmatimonadales bacterium]|nr:hypothetical protein [Gemmatimonadales bacterium]